MWTESIALWLTQYVHHIPLEPTPCIFRRRWRLERYGFLVRVHEALCAESLIRCILRLWWGRVRTWTESIAPLLTQYVHHIPLEPTPCISRRRWRLNHIERVHEAPCAEYDDTVYSESLRSTRLNHMYPFESYPFESYPFESYEFWIIWVLNHTREVYMMNTRIPHRRETVRLTRPGISPVGPAGVSSWILLKKECIIKKRVYY